MLGAAAVYLDLSREQLGAELRSGKSLADVALAEGKTVAGLKAAMLAPATAKLAKAVQSGRITALQREVALEQLGKLADRLIERSAKRA